MSAAEIAARRAAACRAFWSDEPLNLYYRRETGSDAFTLKAFIAFVLTMPRAEFDAVA